MTQWAWRLANSSFLRHNAILFFGAVAVGVLNYAFYPVVARQLEPAAFGEVQAVISLFLQLSMFLTVLTIVTMYVVANYGDAIRRNTVIFELEKVALLVMGAFVLITLLAGEQLREFFKFESVWPFALLGAMLLITVPFTFRTSYLRGVKQFAAGTIANLLAAANKFVFALPLVAMALGTNGALLGVLLAQISALGYAAWRAGKAGLTRPAGLKLLSKPNISQLLPELRYSVLVLVGSLAVMLQLTIDALVVKHFFDAHTAGLYAGVATIARILFFLTASIVQVLLPAVRVDAPAGRNRGRLFLSLFLMIGISLPVLTLFALFPQQIVSGLMGGEYVAVAHLLPLLALTIFLISLLNLLVSYFLALKQFVAGVCALVGFVVVGALMATNHASLEAIVNSLFAGSVVSLVLMAAWILGPKVTKRAQA